MKKFYQNPIFKFSGFDAADNGATLIVNYSVYVKTRIYDSSSDIANLESNFSMESIDHLEHQLLLYCLQKQDEINRTILAMLGRGYNYNEMRDVIGDISKENLRVKAMRARVRLAECMERDYG